MDLQLILAGCVIVTIIVMIIFMSMKETRPVHAVEQPLSPGDHHASQITTHVQRELKGIKHRMEDIEFNQRKLSDKIAALQMARGIEGEQVKYLTQNIN